MKQSNAGNSLTMNTEVQDSVAKHIFTQENIQLSLKASYLPNLIQNLKALHKVT